MRSIFCWNIPFIFYCSRSIFSQNFRSRTVFNYFTRCRNRLKYARYSWRRSCGCRRCSRCGIRIRVWSRIRTRVRSRIWIGVRIGVRVWSRIGIGIGIWGRGWGCTIDYGKSFLLISFNCGIVSFNRTFFNKVKIGIIILIIFGEIIEA